MTAKVYDLQGQRKQVEYAEFLMLLETAEMYIGRLRSLRRKQDGLNDALEIITLMKFNGAFNLQFRDEVTEQLEELLDDLFIELNSTCTS